MLSEISGNSESPQFGINNNKIKSASSCNKFNNLSKNETYYAKKGEPIYDKEMDEDEDGIVTFDELKEYCQKIMQMSNSC